MLTGWSQTMHPVRRRTLVLAFIVLLAACGTGPMQPDPGVVQTLAPGGKLRVGVYMGSPTSMLRHAASGETRGITYEVGAELARRLGVPVEYVEYPRVAEVVAALKAGAVDFTITNASPARALEVDFTPPVLDVELGYLVAPGSAIKALADIDRPGVRVGVTQGSTSRGTLGKAFKNASISEAPTVKAATEMLGSGQLDAFATNKAVLFGMSDDLAGSRVLDGRWGVEHFAIGVPKGRDSGMGFMRRFAEDINASGEVQRAAQRAGLRGNVAPGTK
jgi:polar amino acid transport system substrate-binding protein